MARPAQAVLDALAGAAQREATQYILDIGAGKVRTARRVIKVADEIASAVQFAIESSCSGCLRRKDQCSCPKEGPQGA